MRYGDVNQIVPIQALTAFVQFVPAVGFGPLQVALQNAALTRRRSRDIVLSLGVTAVTAAPACFQVEDVVNGEFERGAGTTWCVHFTHILQCVNRPFVSFSS